MDFYPGGMAEFCPAFASQIYELPENVTDDQATFFDPLIAAIHAVDVGGPKPLDKVAILGAGPIGLLIGQFAKVYGASHTFITDIAAENISIAETTGVDYPLNLSSSDGMLSSSSFAAIMTSVPPFLRIFSDSRILADVPTVLKATLTPSEFVFSITSSYKLFELLLRFKG